MKTRIQAHARALSFVSLAMFVAACGGATPGGRPDDMSAAEHDRAAHQQEAVAEAHDANYDPAATATQARPAHASGVLDVTGLDGPPTVYNPTEEHHDQAEVHHQHAEDHAAAADALRHFEQTECHGVAANARASCPLISGLASADRIDGGVRIHLAPGVASDATLAQIRCHLAFARSRGYEGMAECPLYLRGLEVRAGANGTIEIVAHDSATVDLLRTRIGTHVAGGN